MIANAKLLSKRLPLRAPLSGNDELSLLDNAIHIAAADLAKEFDHRQAFMSMVAGDMRTPLIASQHSLSSLLKNDGLSDNGKIHSRRLESNNKRLLALINDLLTIDSIESGKLDLKLRRVNVQALVDDALESISGIAKVKAVGIECKCANYFVLADGKRIVQVLTNYLSNAIKFSPENSTIRVEAHQEGEMIIVSVVDEGVGMSPETAAHVFDKYYQGLEGKAAEGYGLGLAICKLIIVSHDGRLGVSSNKDGGARFWFSLKSAVETLDPLYVITEE